MEPLQIFSMEIIQFVRKKQADIFVSPSETAHFWRNLIQFVLQHQISIVGSANGQLFNDGDSGYQLVAMFASHIDCLTDGQRALISRMASHPLAGISAFVEPEFKCAATRDAAEWSG